MTTNPPAVPEFGPDFEIDAELSEALALADDDHLADFADLLSAGLDLDRPPIDEGGE